MCAKYIFKEEDDMFGITNNALVKGILIGVGVSAVGFFMPTRRTRTAWTASCAATA